MTHGSLVITSLNVARTGMGPTLVLLHPVGLDLSCWDEVSAHLAPKFDVLRIDLPGHGESPEAEAGITLSEYTAAVRHTLKLAGVQRAHVAGLSFGGMIAQTLAIEHPEICTALIAAGCPCTVPEEARAARAERGRLALREGMAAVIPSTLERWFTPDFLAAGGAESTRRRLLKQSVSGWHLAWQAISRLHTEPRLAGLALPTLCIAGERDQATSVDAVRHVAECIPGARLEIIAGAPHMMSIEAAKPLSHVVLNFLLGCE
jgi:pimeloyl-ACP methyl ester carboxylesterase